MSDKSIADVLDNTVNQLSNGVQALSVAIQKVAPDAWKMLVHQQKVLAYQDIAIGLLLLTGCIIWAFIYKYFVYNKFVKLIEEDNEFVIGQCVCGAIALIITAVMLNFSIEHVTDGFVRYSSAEYYAAKDVIGMIK